MRVSQRGYFRFGAVAALLITLSGCVVSEYDISTDLKQEFPIKSGEYSSDDVIVRLSRTVDGYDYFSDAFYDGAPTTIRFFQIPEYDSFIIQALMATNKPADKPKYGYAFFRPIGSSFEFSNGPLPLSIKQIVAANYLGGLVKKDMLSGPPPSFHP
jgi:hypothetical protein